MALTLRQIFNSVTKTDPKLLDKPLYINDFDEAAQVDCIDLYWKDAEGYVMDEEAKEEAICEADYPLHYANNLEKVVVIS